MGQVGEISPEILEACRRGDREAFRALYEAHKDRVYSVALHFFKGDAATAADVTQQVFVKVLARVQQRPRLPAVRRRRAELLPRQSM